MPVRCNYCHQTFNLSPDYMAMVLPKALEKKHKYHVVDCINCRKQIKVPVDQMERFATPAADEGEGEAESATASQPDDTTPAA